MANRRCLLLFFGLCILGLPAHAGWLDFGGEKPGKKSAAKGRTLHILTWEDYIDPELTAQFERQTGAQVEWSYFEDDHHRDTILKEQGTMGTDLVLVNEKNLDLYRKRGWLAPLTPVEFPNLRHIAKRWLERFPAAQGYAAPYFWGTTGILYRTDLVDRAITSWNQLLQPQEQLRGRIQMPSDPRELVSIALLASGGSLNAEDMDIYESAKARLLDQQPYVRIYGPQELNEEDPIVQGEVVASASYSGDALTLQEFNENLKYVIPEEGGGFWMDFFVVMRSSQQKDLAYAFLNFLNEGEIAARNADYVYYATPNTAALETLSAEYRNNPVIFPEDAVLARCEAQKPLPVWVGGHITNIAAQVVR